MPSAHGAPGYRRRKNENHGMACGVYDPYVLQEASERKMTREQKKTIEREFYRYKENKEAGGDFLKDYAYSRIAVNYEGDRVYGSGLNTTENGVVNAVSKDLSKSVRAYKWSVIFEKTMDRFRWTQKDKLMRMKYIERKGVTRICTDIGIERRTYFYWLDEILIHAIQWCYALNISI